MTDETKKFRSSDQKECDRCRFYPSYARTSIAAGPVLEYLVVKVRGEVRQNLCADHVKYLRKNGARLVEIGAEKS